MKHMGIAMILSGLLLSSCSSLPEENAELRTKNAALQAKLLQSYRDSFEQHEYPKLNVFAKQGYDWYWSLSWIESSGMGTKRERERVEGEHGKQSLAIWDEGWHAAYSIHCRSCGRDPVTMKRESPTTKSTLSSEAAPSAAPSER